MSLLDRIVKGPYPLQIFLFVVGVIAAGITAVAVMAQGYFVYQGHAVIPGATHVSETFFTGFLAVFITGIILHRHASMGGQCATLDLRGRCPFVGIFILGLTLGAIATALVYFIQGTGDIAYRDLVYTKGVQGLVTGFLTPYLFHFLKLLKHPKVIA